MNKIKILNKVKENKISLEKAYKLLYPTITPKKARYIRLKFNIPESKAANRLLKILFALPIPVWLMRIAMRNSDQVVSEEIPIKISELLKNNLYKGMFINVISEDGVKVLIKTI